MRTDQYVRGEASPKHDLLFAGSVLPFGLDHVAMHADADLYREEGDHERAQLIEDAIGADISMGTAGAFMPGAVSHLAGLSRRVTTKPASVLRNTPGVAIGRTTGVEAGANWLRGSAGNAGHIPKQIADNLRGRTFNTFDDFRAAFWKEVGNSTHLSSSFSKENVARMKQGLAPFVPTSQQYGGGRNYVLHHVTPIQHGGGVYDMDNIIVATPLYHSQILSPSYHYGNGDRLGGI